MSHILKSIKSAQKERAAKEAKDKGFRISSILNPLDIGKKRFQLSKNTCLLIVIVSLFSFSIVYTVYSFYFKRRPIGKGIRNNIVALGKTGVPKNELQKPESPDTSIRETSSLPPRIDEKQLIAQKASAKLDELKIKAEPENEQSDLKADTRKVDQKGESESNVDTSGMVSTNTGNELIKTSSGSELQKPASPDILSKSSDLSVYHFNSGLLYQKQRKMEKAKKEYEKVISLDPLNVEVHNNLGMVYKDLGELDKAIAEYKKALALNSNYKNAHYNQAVALYLKGELEAAAKECSLAIAIDPKDSACYNTLGLIYKKMGRNSSAMDVFQKALSINPSYSQTHYNMALLLEQEGMAEEAIFHYQKFIVLSNPENNRNLIDRVKKHLEQIPVQ